MLYFFMGDKLAIRDGKSGQPDSRKQYETTNVWLGDTGGESHPDLVVQKWMAEIEQRQR